jgi:alkylhydroperoxidase family enzyme
VRGKAKRKENPEWLHGCLSPEALMQLTLTIAAANFTNRVNEAMGTELEH